MQRPCLEKSPKSFQRLAWNFLNATTFLDAHLARAGHIAGPRPSAREIEDIRFGFEIAKEVSRLDIGQSVIVKSGTVLAVEAFEEPMNASAGEPWTQGCPPRQGNQAESGPAFRCAGHR